MAALGPHIETLTGEPALPARTRTVTPTEAPAPEGPGWLTDWPVAPVQEPVLVPAGAPAKEGARR